MLDQVVVIIPALNEAESLPWVLGDLPKVRHVIVVDNGSTDVTAAVASAHGAVVLDELERGYGAACLRGLAAVRELIDAGEPAPEVVVFLDADYSDHPERLPELVEPILGGRADFVLGSRLLGRREAGAMPLQSVLGNRLACILLRTCVGAHYTDLGPFRAIRYPSLCSLNMADRAVQDNRRVARNIAHRFRVELVVTHETSPGNTADVEFRPGARVEQDDVLADRAKLVDADDRHRKPEQPPQLPVELGVLHHRLFGHIRPGPAASTQVHNCDDCYQANPW